MPFTSLPDLADPGRFAMFFDLDGTLADIAERPEEVHLKPPIREALRHLRECLGGALAIVSGRDITSIDRVLAPLVLPVAAVHGLLRRDATGAIHAPDLNGDALADIEASLTRWVANHPGLLIERKPGALALHYRLRPELAAACIARMEMAATRVGRVRLQHGKMVVEAVVHNGNKGTAILGFLAEAPFQGRVPVFAGDDRTDEDGFAAVNARGGISIKVGEGETQARYRASDIRAFQAWLARLALSFV